METTYMEKFCGSAEEQGLQANYLKGFLISCHSEDSILYINVGDKELDFFRKNQEVRGSFTQHPAELREGISPVYAENRHLLLELKVPSPSKEDRIIKMLEDLSGYNLVNLLE